MNGEESGFGETFIVLETEDGEEIVIEINDTVEYKGETYVSFYTRGDDDEDAVDDDEDEIAILKIEEEDGEEIFVTVDDDAVLDAVFELFVERRANEILGGDDDE